MFDQIPGEIRNSIYRYALTASAPLSVQMPPQDQARLSLCRKGTYRLVSHTANGQWIELQKQGTKVLNLEFNQLKYTCRQAYIETASIEVQYNDLIFDDQSKGNDPASLQLVSFLNDIGPTRLPWLKGGTVILLDRSTYFLSNTASMIAALASLCRKLPSVTFKYVIPDFGQRIAPVYLDMNALQSFVAAGLCYLHALRGERPSADWGSAFRLRIQGTMLQRFIRGKAWAAEVDNRALQAPNLRFWPTLQPMDEAKFDHVIQELRVEYSEACAIRTMDLVKRWTQEGI